MNITRSGTQPSQKGPAEYFTGSVRIDSRFQGTAPARVGGGDRDLRARRAHGLAYAPARPDPDRHVRARLGSGRGWRQGGDPFRRRRLVPARREALARRERGDRDESYRHRGSARRQDRRMDGARHRSSSTGRDDARRAPSNRSPISSRTRDLRYDEPLPTLRLLPSALRGAAPAASGSGCRADPHQQRRHRVHASSGGHLHDGVR